MNIDVVTTTEATQRLNPWFSMWIKPRATIQQVIETDPTRWILLLVALDGIFQVLDRAVDKNFGDHMHWTSILLIAAITGPILGLIGLYLSGWLIGWTGRWIGGQGTHENIRAAIAWAKIPTIWVLALWGPMMLVFGQGLFVSPQYRAAENMDLAYNIWGFAIIIFFAEITSFILLCQALGQVQGFSGWKAFGNILLAGLILIIPFIMIFVFIFLGIGMFAR
ncbi:MAG: Yip1 family protein [Pseudomonadota bacterium]